MTTNACPCIYERTKAFRKSPFRRSGYSRRQISTVSSIVVCAICLCYLTVPIACTPATLTLGEQPVSEKDKEPLVAIAQTIEGPGINRVEVYYYSFSTMTRVNVTEERMLDLGWYDYRVIIRGGCIKKQSCLLRALRETKLEPVDKVYGELATRLAFFVYNSDKDDKPSARISVSPFAMTVNGMQFKVNGSALALLREVILLLPPCAQEDILEYLLNTWAH